MNHRFYLQALGVTGLFVALLIVIWIALGGPASEADVQHSNSTRTAIAMTEIFLLRPFSTETPPASILPTSISLTKAPSSGSVSARTLVPTPINTPIPQTGTATPIATPLNPLSTSSAPGIPRTGVQEPAEFIRWYFERVWKERDYQNLWDNYLTASFKAHVGSGLFEDYVVWWDSVERVDVNSVDVLENNGTNAWIRVNITLRMKDGHVLPNQMFDYDLLYEAGRNTWMFDYSP